MKIRSVVTLFASLGLVVFASTRAFSGEDKPADGGMPGMTPEMMKHMQECMKNMNAGDHHKLLDNFVGKWKTTSKMWMGGPGTEAIVTNGVSEVKSILGGRFVMEEHHGEIMMPDEKMQIKKMPHEGIGIFGYDNDRNMYTGSWISNLSTATLTFKGTSAPGSNLITMYGEMDEPMMKIYGRHVKYVNKIVSKDKHIFELVDLAAGQDYKVIEVTYERQ